MKTALVLAVAFFVQAPTPIPNSPNTDVFQVASHLYLLSQVPSTAPLVFVNRMLMCQACAVPDYTLAGNILTFTGYRVVAPAVVQVVYAPTGTYNVVTAVSGVGLAVVSAANQPTVWSIDTAAVLYRVAPPTAPGACQASGATSQDAAGYAYFCTLTAAGALVWMRTPAPLVSTW